MQSRSPKGNESVSKQTDDTFTSRAGAAEAANLELQLMVMHSPEQASTQCDGDAFHWKGDKEIGTQTCNWTFSVNVQKDANCKQTGDN